MNSFDIVVYLALAIAVIAGFRAGLLRSAITILAYLVAMPVAVWIMSLLAPAIGNGDSPVSQNSVLFFGIFLAAGILLGWLARMALDDAIGPETGFFDRLGGAVLGAVPFLSMMGQTGFRSLPPDVTAFIDRLKHDRRI